jgi:hypothetical protein
MPPSCVAPPLWSAVLSPPTHAHKLEGPVAHQCATCPSRLLSLQRTCCANKFFSSCRWMSSAWSASMIMRCSFASGVNCGSPLQVCTKARSRSSASAFTSAQDTSVQMMHCPRKCAFHATCSRSSFHICCVLQAQEICCSGCEGLGSAVPLTTTCSKDGRRKQTYLACARPKL